MSAPDEVLDAALEAINEIAQLDGFGPWREVGPLAHADAGRTGHATAYLEVAVPGQPHHEAVHLVADPNPASDRPVFDDGAAADRARDTALDNELGVTG